jgi:predicted small lipoprotein YifL
MNARTLLAITAAGLALAGCGYKGPLTLPEKPGEVTTRPGPAGAKSSRPAEGGKATPPKTSTETAPSEAAPPEVPTRTGGSGG